MNSIPKKMLLVGFALLLSACAHYPQHYAYYPGNDAYSSGYTIMHRNYYGERPDHYESGYGQGRSYFPSHQRHDQYNAPHWGNDAFGHQHDRGYDHPFNYGNNRRHDDGSHRDNFDRKNHH